jgi:hypothetical protein
VTDVKCTLPLLSLQQAPWSLTLGDSIYATVSATNTYGESSDSPAGNGATMVLVPDSPISVQDNPEVTSATVIGLTWQNGKSSGGSPVIDYRVSYDQSIGSYVVLADGITTQSYQTEVLLTPGANYKFRVEARNSVGFSLPSVEVTILCAQVPDKPTAPTTTQSSDRLDVSWAAPGDGGADITAYKILI